MSEMKWKSFRRKAWAFVLALCLSLSLCPQLIGTAYAVGEAAMDQLLNWGVVGGYPDGGLHPERSLTRAEFVAMVNRAYGYTQTGATPFIDVPNTAWFYDDIGIAYNANYFGGVSPRMAAPDSSLTREQAMVLLARNMRLDPVAGEVTEFADGRNFADWSRGYARAAAQMGLIGGYGDGSYKPQNNISRGEMGIMLQRALGTLVNTPGTHTLSDTYGNVTISSTGTTLKDTTIAGNLYITGGLDLGDITLDNVRVLGDIIVAGGGESQSGESIILRNVEADSLLVDSIADQYVSLRAEGNTEIADTLLRSDAFVQDRTRPGNGLLNVSLESPDVPASFTLSGNLENVVNKTPGSLLNIAIGTVDTLTIDEKARDSTLNLDVNSTASTLNLDTATNVSGIGDIDKLFVNAAGSTVEMLPDDITIRPGLTASIAGETMNATQAQESSTDPRLLAGYPKLRNVAPTNATGVYSANKAGTVYWAVSATVDGSVAEEELITPTEGNAQGNVARLPYGNLAIAASDTEVTAAIANLTPDGNYYLSAVMTDARGRKSPVKVVSFVTPDNTPPAFNAGYPVVSQNEWEYERNEDKSIKTENGKPVINYHVQVSAMPNKNCTLYYVLYDQGSTAPTAQQFRIGALGAPLQSGTQDAVKNYINYVDFDGLDELKTYDAYFCLIDADGSRSSAVQKLTFTTVDGTPPEFQYETPAITNEAATALTLNVNVNENATVYWVVSRSGDYIKDPNAVETTDPKWDAELWWEHATRQIENGANGVRNGSLAVRSGIDSTLNITGLTAATDYYIYYVAKDTAGNYSKFTRANIYPQRYYVNGNTLDNVPPTVTQEFTNPGSTEANRPYSDTNIRIVFSEPVMQYSTNRRNERANFESLYKLYKDVEEASADQKSDKQETLAKALRETIKLYNPATIGNGTVDERTSANGSTVGDSWVIDYRNAIVEYDPTNAETMVVEFPTVADDPSTPRDENLDSALNLSSGATYYFVVNDIADTSSSMNRLARTQLPNFTTISAQVTLLEINVPSVKVGDDSVPIDKAFSLTPNSTNVEDSMDWDVIFWCDTSVSFEVYELKENKNGTTATPVRKVVNGAVSPASSATDVEIINNSISSNTDPTLDDFSGYAGRSLFRHFYGLDFNPSVTGKGNVISDKDTDEGKALKASGTLAGDPKYYGIHFTSVNHVREASRSRPDGDPQHTWDADFNVRLSVLTGLSTNLGNLSSNITKDSLSTHEAYWGVSQIHTPRPFVMQELFHNDVAPGFAASFPQIVTSDVEATMEVLLERPGTLYYAVMPAREEKTNTATSYRTSMTTTLLSTKSPVSSLSQVPVIGTDSPAALLSEPTSNMIYTLNFNDNSIKYGKVSVGNSSVKIPLENLDPKQLYFVYFVTQGEGQVYSANVMLYRFTTQEVNRPHLLLTAINSSTVDVRSTDMDATGDYAIFLMDGLPSTLSAPFYSILGSEFQSYFTTTTSGSTTTVTPTSDCPNALKEYLDKSVYVALTNQGTSGGSLYDTYASNAHKEKLRELITGRGTTEEGLIDSSQGILLTRSVADRVNCETTYPAMEPILHYLFVAEARSTAADESAPAENYGFAAYQPVYIRDTSAPAIETIYSQDLTVDYTDSSAGSSSYVINGYITLVFDRDLYLMQGLSNRVAFTNKTIKTNFAQSTASNKITVDSGSKSNSTGIRVVKLALSKVRDGDVFVANYNVVSQYSSPDPQKQLTLSVRYDDSINRVIVTINPADPWYLAGSANFTPVDVKAPAATGISLSPNSLRLSTDPASDNYVGKIAATILPASAATGKTIEWTVSVPGSSSPPPVSLSRSLTQSGEEITVTPSSAGTATLTATVVGSSPAITATCTVTITAPTPQVTLSQYVIYLASGETAQLTATLKNYNGDYHFEWVTGKPSVANPGIDDGFGNTTIRAGTAGTATIRVNVYEGQGNSNRIATATCQVEVT